jgi:hypothetical protein
MGRVEDHLERSWPPGNADLELELVAGLVSADDAPIPRECDALRPGSLRRLRANGIAKRFEHCG